MSGRSSLQNQIYIDNISFTPPLPKSITDSTLPLTVSLIPSLPEPMTNSSMISMLPYFCLLYTTAPKFVNGPVLPPLSGPFTPPLPKSITDSLMISMLPPLNVCQHTTTRRPTATKVAVGKNRLWLAVHAFVLYLIFGT